MRQLDFIGPGQVEWRDVPEPKLQGDGEALVRPVAVATCDLDVGLLRGKMTLFEGPFPLGHEGVAHVVDVGAGVSAVRPGDLVVVPFQISCGICSACGRGHTANCTAVPQGSMYGLQPFGGEWGGFLSDLVRVPFADAMLVPVPEGVDPAAIASCSDNVPDGLRTVGPALEQQPGAAVLVVGGGAPSVPLYAVALAVVLGAGRVDYLDTDPARLERASALGAQVIDERAPRRLGPYPITVDASGTAEGLGCALRSTAPDGVCTSIGIFEQDTPVPLLEMYTNVVTFRTGRVHARPAIPKILELVADGRFHPEAVTSAVIGWDDAIDALADPPDKLIVTRGRSESS
jgi:alcohol dehydrogenase